MDLDAAQHNSRRRQGVFIFGVMLLGTTAYCYSKAVFQDFRIRTYEVTEGTILDTHIEEKEVVVYRGMNETSYRPVIDYKYTVDMDEFRNDQLAPSGHPFVGEGHTSSRLWAEEVLRNYRTGQPVSIYYNPRFPHESFLLAHIDTKFYGFSLLCVAVYILIVVGCWGTKFDVQKQKWCINVSQYGSRRKKLIYTFLLWHLNGVFMAGHYLWATTPPYDAFLTTYFPLYTAGGAVGLVVTLMTIRKTVAQKSDVPDHAD